MQAIEANDPGHPLRLPGRDYDKPGLLETTIPAKSGIVLLLPRVGPLEEIPPCWQTPDSMMQSGLQVSGSLETQTQSDAQNTGIRFVPSKTGLRIDIAADSGVERLSQLQLKAGRPGFVFPVVGQL